MALTGGETGTSGQRHLVDLITGNDAVVRTDLQTEKPKPFDRCIF